MKNYLLLKIIFILLVFLGESFYLYAEVYTANNAFKRGFSSKDYVKSLVIALIGAIIFLGSIYFGFSVFRDVWLLAIISICAIVIVQPILIYLFFGSLPKNLTLLSFILAIIALIFSLFE